MKKVLLVSMSLLVCGLLTSCGSNSNLEGSTWVAVQKSAEMKMEATMTLSFKNATEAEMTMEMKMDGEKPMTVTAGLFTYTCNEQQVVLTNKDDGDSATLRRENGKLIAPPDNSGVELVYKKK